ncbi:MAG: hypothetical protein VB862_14300, partial [Pirellulaceae bacterium]
TETKRVDEQGELLSDEAIEKWEASQADESDSGLDPADEKATALGEDGLPRRVVETPPVPTKKADLVDSHFALVAETSAATLKLISTVIFFVIGLVIFVTVVRLAVSDSDESFWSATLSGLFQVFVLFSVAYLFRAISYLQRGQLRILRILESNRSDQTHR